MSELRGTENIALDPGFSVICVWPATVVGKDQVAEFTDYLLRETGARVQYLEEVTTAPDIEFGCPVPGTGGRNDVLFAVHDDDVTKFAVPRLAFGIRWLSDVLPRDAGLYPARVSNYLDEEPVHEDAAEIGASTRGV